jgi:hypothetical protein
MYVSFQQNIFIYVLAYPYSLLHVIRNVSMNETQTMFNYFYNHTTIITMMSQHLLALIIQSRIPERYNKQPGMSQGTSFLVQLLLHSPELSVQLSYSKAWLPLLNMAHPSLFNQTYSFIHSLFFQLYLFSQLFI